MMDENRKSQKSKIVQMHHSPRNCPQLSSTVYQRAQRSVCLQNQCLLRDCMHAPSSSMLARWPPGGHNNRLMSILTAECCACPHPSAPKPRKLSACLPAPPRPRIHPPKHFSSLPRPHVSCDSNVCCGLGVNSSFEGLRFRKLRIACMHAREP